MRQSSRGKLWKKRRPRKKVPAVRCASCQVALAPGEPIICRDCDLAETRREVEATWL